MRFECWFVVCFFSQDRVLLYRQVWSQICGSPTSAPAPGTSITGVTLHAGLEHGVLPLEVLAMNPVPASFSHY